MKYIVYDPKTNIVDGGVEVHDDLLPMWPELETRAYNTGTDTEWSDIVANPRQYIVSEAGGFHLEKIQDKLKNNEE